MSVRRARPADLPLIAEMLQRLSEQTRYLRYLHPTSGAPEWSRAEASRMLPRPGARTTTLIATMQPGSVTEVVGVAELAWGSTAAAPGEFALLVRDDEQSRGIGRALGRRLIVEALARGLSELRADLLPENRAALRLLRRSGIPHTTAFNDGLIRVTLQLPLLRAVGVAAGVTHDVSGVTPNGPYWFTDSKPAYKGERSS